jgi:hypothetical protein
MFKFGMSVPVFFYMSPRIANPNLIFRVLLFGFIREGLRILSLKSRRIELITEIGAAAELFVLFYRS